MKLCETFEEKLIIFSIPFLFNLLKNNNYIKFKNKNDFDYSIIIFLIFFGFLFLTDFLMLIRKDYWAAGKGFSFLSPFFIIFLSIPLFKISFNKKIFCHPIIFFLLFQVLFGFIRIYSSSNKYGIHYLNPYPSNQWDSIKKEINWNLDNLKKQLAKEDVLQISVADRFLESYILLYCFENNIRYFKTTPVKEYFGGGENYGFQNKLRGIGKKYILTENKNIIKIKNNNSKEIIINSSLMLKENSSLTLSINKGWESLISIDKKYYYMDSKQADIIINNSSDNIKKINLALEFNSFNVKNTISVFLNSKKIIDSVNNGKFILTNLDLIKGDNKLLFITRFPPKIIDYDKFMKRNYAFSSIVIEENN